MLMLASYMFPFHQATLLQCWMVYNQAWLLFSHGCRQINWNWTQTKRNSSSLGMNGNGAYIYVSNRAFGCWNLPSKICSQSWSDLWQKLPTSSHIYLQSAVHVLYIRDLRRIRRHLDLDSAKLLANALVSSRLDYCNSLLSGITETDLTKLQRVLNRLARVVTKSPPFTRSVPLLHSLHWLPVKYRVHFKICLLTYKALHEEQPVYLHSLIAISLPSRSLRSNRGITLSIPRIKTNTGARAFSSCAPSLWNNLPLSVRSATSVATFRRCLKTYLFDLAFPP